MHSDFYIVIMKEWLGVSNISVWIFSVGCGELLRCPLSGTLLVMAIDPLLTIFEKYIHTPGLGQVYACADDTGAATKNLMGLKILSRLSELFRKATGLTLRPSKCVGIVVPITLSDLNLRMFKQFVAQPIPE